MINKKLLLIGNGRMGSAFTAFLHDKYKMTVVSPNSRPKYDIPYYKSLGEVNDCFDYMIFAVKPFVLPQVLRLLNRNMYHNNTLFLSIIAGASLSFFHKNLGEDARIVRSMPNLPIHVGKGIIPVYPQIEVEFLKHFGKVIYVNEELDINKFTSLTGSGSGFVFSMLDMYQKAQKSLDIKTEFDDKQVIIDLFEGAIELMKKSQFDFSQQRNNVTTQRGTTFEGLKSLDKCSPLFEECLVKAYHRANELGQETMENLNKTL